MPELKKLLADLERFHGKPALPPAQGPFELVLWENGCYLLPDQRRAEVFEALRREVGLNAEAIWKASKEDLLPLAAMGGMGPDTRVFRWQEIARITVQQFAGDLNQILTWDYGKAKKALKLFPTIGDPGAEKILASSEESVGHSDVRMAAGKSACAVGEPDAGIHRPRLLCS